MGETAMNIKEWSIMIFFGLLFAAVYCAALLGKIRFLRWLL